MKKLKKINGAKLNRKELKMINGGFPPDPIDGPGGGVGSGGGNNNGCICFCLVPSIFGGFKADFVPCNSFCEDQTDPLIIGC